MAIGVTFELSGKSGGFVRAVGKAKASVTSLKNSVMGFAQSKAVQLLGAGALIGTFTSLGRAALDLGASLDATSQKLGIGTDLIQKLGFAGEQFNISQDTTNMALQRFTRRLGEAQQGTGELLPVLEQYGVQMRNNDGTLRSAEAVLGDYADLLKQTKDPQERLRLAFKAFDSEGAGLVAVLKDGKEGLAQWGDEAVRQGQVVEENTVKALARASNEIANFKREITVGFAEVLVNFRTEAGLKVIGLQLSKAAANFSVIILDGIFQVATFIPKWIGTKLTDVATSFLKTLLGPLASFDFAQTIIAKIESGAATLKGVIEETRPRVFMDSMNESMDLLIAEYKHAADIQKAAANEAAETVKHATTESAQSAATSYDDARRKIQAANEELKNAGTDAGTSVAEGGKSAGEAITTAAHAMKQSLQFIATSANFADASDDELRELIRRNQATSRKEKARGTIGNLMTAARLDTETANAQRELDFRRELRRDYALNPEMARRNFAGDPLQFDRIVAQLVTGQKDTTRILEETQETNRILRGKFRSQ